MQRPHKLLKIYQTPFHDKASFWETDSKLSNTGTKEKGLGKNEGKEPGDLTMLSAIVLKYSLKL